MPSRGIDGRAHLKTILIFFRRRTLYTDIANIQISMLKIYRFFLYLITFFIAKQIISES